MPVSPFENFTAAEVIRIESSEGRDCEQCTQMQPITRVQRRMIILSVLSESFFIKGLSRRKISAARTRAMMFITGLSAW